VTPREDVAQLAAALGWRVETADGWVRVTRADGATEWRVSDSAVEWSWLRAELRRRARAIVQRDGANPDAADDAGRLRARVVASVREVEIARSHLARVLSDARVAVDEEREAVEVLARTLSGLPAESAAALRALAISHGAADPA
jgi:hypothetical protein